VSSPSYTRIIVTRSKLSLACFLSLRLINNTVHHSSDLPTALIYYQSIIRPWCHALTGSWWLQATTQSVTQWRIHWQCNGARGKTCYSGPAHQTDWTM